jgi:hypothetical protein
MKKSISLVALAFGVTSAFAQDLTSKKGEPFLPEAGDWSIGVDATPFLNYAGNFFGGRVGTNNQAPTFNFANTLGTIQGKMFKDANTAYRASLRIQYNSSKDRAVVTEHVNSSALTDALASTGDAKYDQKKSTDRLIVLGVGMEKRRGKTRLQGVYGAEAFVYGGSTKEKYKYANDLTQTAEDLTTAFQENIDANDAAYTHNFGSNIATSLNGYTNVDAARVLKRKSNGFVGVGVRAFIGAEYFIAPKVSIGGEFGWGVGYQLNTKDKATWDAEGTGTTATTQTAGEVKTKDSVNGGSSIMIDTDNSNTMLGASGTIRLNFHF